MTQELEGPFGGKLTKKGEKMLGEIRDEFGEKDQILLSELTVFLKARKVKYPSVAIMFRGVQEMVESLGFKPMYGDWVDKNGVKRNGWIGFDRNDGSYPEKWELGEGLTGEEQLIKAEEEEKLRKSLEAQE